MKTLLELIAIGDDVGIILPQEMLDRLGVAAGDFIYAVATETTLFLTPLKPDAK
ncbi:MAG: hypothetical protein JWM57_1075 [Phycisphaerales bacterium]|nr:hypothetical protein [Phycisphaerales bacterium]